MNKGIFFNYQKKIKYKIMYNRLIKLILPFYLVSVAFSACLAVDVLKDVGFSEVQELTKVDESVICKALFEKTGTCVPVARVEAKIIADTSDLTDAMNIAKDLSDAFTKLSDLVKENFTDKLDEVNQIKEKLITSMDQCVIGWNNIQKGTTCYMASGDATEYTEMGSKIIIDVHTSSVGKELDKCLDFLDGICLLTTGISVSTDLVINEKAFQTNLGLNGDFCNALKKVFASVDKDEIEKRHEIMINKILPFDFNLIPAKDFLNDLGNKVEDLLNDIGDSLKDFFSLKSRLLFTESDIELRAKSDGRKIITDAFDKRGYRFVMGFVAFVSLLLI